MTVVVDSSALLAILRGETSTPEVVAALDAADELVISAATLVEATIVAESRLGPAGVQLLERLLRTASIRTEPLTAEVAHEVIDGWRSFGRGRHPAGLNLGDCFTYGLARHLDAPVVCTGDDFRRTDLQTLP